MLIMNKGETRTLDAVIASCDGLPFTIHEARYELIRHVCNGEDVTEDAGVCEISDKTLTCTLTPAEEALYIVRFTMQIAGETVIRKVHIQVG